MNRLSADQFFGSISVKAAGARQPEGMTFELTYGCNLRCLHCYNPTHRRLPHELATEEVYSILDQVSDLGVLNVTFTGGEPTVRPDIVHILRHARRRGLLLNLLTNATRVTLPFASLLQDVGVSEIHVSIYGATEATYEQMTAVPGSYTLFVQGLQRLAAVHLPVTVRMPVTTVNQKEIDGCRTLVENHGFKFQYCLDMMPRTDGDRTPLRYRLSPQAKHKMDQGFLDPPTMRPPEETCRSASFIDCACGRSRFAVTPYGEMNLCVAFPIPRYSLREGTVATGWEVLKHTVDHASPGPTYECRTCTVRPHCRQGRSDAWLETGDMDRCLPHFKEFARLEQQSYVLPDSRRPR